MKERRSPKFYKPRQPPDGVIYPDNIYPKNIRGYYSDIDVLIQKDGSIDTVIMLFARCFDNMKDYLSYMYKIKTFEQLIGDERLYNGDLDEIVSYVSFECTIPKDFQQEALFRLIESPDGFAEWVDNHNGYSGMPDWRS